MFRPTLLFTLILALPLSLSSTGCKKKDAPPKDGVAADGEKKHFDFRPKGGSTTILGKARDRALDLRLISEMSQVTTLLLADMIDKSPADKAGWLALLRDLRNLRPLVDSGEVVVFNNVDLRRGGSGTVLMYETRVETDDDGIVLTCDGTAQRMNKATFSALNKPR